ncbi:hypothetical protein CERSUDRAFT_103673 [Gelatoporia subvermispora B]|uniref:Probable RNA polymerase II nuclear localization protein SLC7A6OS n=1 Tax=Ceriporiopsis subvermispora (strain B) TaxID=914234 RepID=M2RLF8_CERS8|nr:hypothetical protein CERSUDRAFT_103673 [Gelatoporia subvermispora B]
MQGENSRRPYTIVRIKRKRTEEPLEALVLDKSRRKRTRGARIFQFAETVEPGAWEDEEKKKELESRISTLASQSAQSSTSAASPITPATSTEPVAASPPPATPQSTLQPSQDGPARHYKILPAAGSTPEASRRRHSTAPPKVWSQKELEAAQKARSAFTLYDAVLSPPSGDRRVARGAPEDEEMAKFLPLLQEYLKVSDIPPPSSSSNSILAPSVSGNVSDGEDGDYVYDVFYQRPTTFEELYLPTSGSGNIGTLTSLPEELSWMYDLDEESEPGDDEDEDSNAEEYYKNDYPEEEDDDFWSDGGSEGSDVFHEQSDSDDVVFNDATDDGAWR